MPRKEYDPLARIPSPEVLRERLAETLALADKLRILLEVAERLQSPTAGDGSAVLEATKAKGGRDA